MEIYLETFPIKSAAEIIKKCLVKMNHYLPVDIKHRILNSFDSTAQEITLIDDVLIDTFYYIPKPQRIVVNFMIYHFAR